MGLGIEIVYPTKPLAEGVLAFSTTRSAGVSSGVYSLFNLATHVGDDLEKVEQNRKLLDEFIAAQVGVVKPVFWLNQQHTNKVVYTEKFLEAPVADAVWTDKPNQPLAVLTADCLPILLASKQGNLVAAIHAGWRGLAQGIIQHTLAALPEKSENLTAWIGPAISQEFFQVGVEVKQEFVEQNPSWKQFFKPDLEGKFLADLPAIAEDILQEVGVVSQSAEQVKSNLCTFSDERFYSYRKSGETGRIASIIMLT